MRKNSWRATKATRVLSALQRIGWRIKRQKGSHRTLERRGWADCVFAYHERAELGPVALEKLGKKTGLTPGDL
jgi:predicted RNA binding protein YcfA (HicA-like mRNA interferase family)